jgi:hypothetical protein
MADDVRQLCEPIRAAVGRRGEARIVSHPPLLDALRTAAGPGAASQGPERRRVPDSRPPVGWSADTADALAEVYVGISFWHAKLDLPSPPRFLHGCLHASCRVLVLRERGGPVCAGAGLTEVDWHKAVLRRLVGEAPTLAPSIADWLAADVESWWALAARRCGWSLEQLRRLR